VRIDGRLLRRPDGEAEQKPGGQIWAEGVQGRIIPAEVRAGGARGERDIHAVVDQYGNRKGGDQGTGQLQNFGWRAIFPTDLNYCRATGYRAAADGNRIPPLEQDGIRDHHQAQLIGECHDQDPARPAWSDHGGRQYE